jgi:hypothetical protein
LEQKEWLKNNIGKTREDWKAYKKSRKEAAKKAAKQAANATADALPAPPS